MSDSSNTDEHTKTDAIQYHPLRGEPGDKSFGEEDRYSSPEPPAGHQDSCDLGEQAFFLKAINEDLDLFRPRWTPLSNSPPIVLAAEQSIHEKRVVESPINKPAMCRRRAELLAAGRCAPEAPVPVSGIGSSYDLILKGGRVIDERNSLDGVMDVARSRGGRSRRWRHRLLRERRKCATSRAASWRQGSSTSTRMSTTRRTSPSVDPGFIARRSACTTLIDAGSAGAGNYDGFATT